MKNESFLRLRTPWAQEYACFFVYPGFEVRRGRQGGWRESEAQHGRRVRIK